MIITIDGPAVSGKSTIAKELAQALGFYYLQTGLLYRGLTYLLMQEGHDPVDLPTRIGTTLTEQFITTLAHSLVYTYEKGTAKLCVGGEDITAHATNAALDNPTSVLSALPLVRNVLNTLQRSIAATHDSVIEGRDSGSVVFPQADYKFFLTASIQERVRRFLNDPQRATTMSFKEAQVLLEVRDKRDQERAVAPLIVPHGAIIIDNTTMNKQETVQLMLHHLATFPK